MEAIKIDFWIVKHHKNPMQVVNVHKSTPFIKQNIGLCINMVLFQYWQFKNSSMQV